MREKAREFFEEARLLAAAKKYNGAASRMYYALYHIVVAILEEKGIKQSDLSHKVDPNNHKYWLHEVVTKNSTLAGVDHRDRKIIDDLYQLRVKADYFNVSVNPDEIQVMFPKVQSMMCGLGIEIK